VLTPHLGASTAEGQRNVSVDVCNSVREALLSGELSGAVNVEGGERAEWSDMRDAMQLARRTAAMARALLADRGAKAVDQLTLRLSRELVGGEKLLLAAASIGVVEDVVDARLNIVNGRAQAEARGIALSVAPIPAPAPAYQLQVTVRGQGSRSVSPALRRPVPARASRVSATLRSTSCRVAR
jgi:D-3-phosphoglycerate dehydrogenase